jgi:hypothetical protein
MRKMVRAGAGAAIFDKQEPEPEPHKNGPAPQLCQQLHSILIFSTYIISMAKCYLVEVHECRLWWERLLCRPQNYLLDHPLCPLKTAKGVV